MISPQAWNKVKVSKHHYAVSLAEMGNDVFFLNPPDPMANGISIEATEHERVRSVRYKSFFPISLRFRFGIVFSRLMRFQVRRIMKKLGHIDIVWCFDPNLYGDLGVFGADIKIFHPVDVFKHAHAMQVARSADVIFSVSPTILQSFVSIKTPGYFVNHGLGSAFVELAQKEVWLTDCGPILNVAYVGNLLIPYIDRELLKEVICRSPHVRFHFFGPYKEEHSSLGGGDEDASDFILFLQEAANVELHGPLGSVELAQRMLPMDAFLMCYSGQRPGYDASNSHKMLEYLSTGRAVISTPLLAYLDHQDIVTMPVQEPREQYADFFVAALGRISDLNAPDLQQKRRQLALANSYPNQIKSIEHILVELNLLA